MKIKSIEIKNFKSIAEQTFVFNDVNVLIGTNASGKSNFTHIFAFLKSIKKDGIHKAVTNFGGINSIKNFNADEPVQIKIELTLEVAQIVEKRRNVALARVMNRIIYEIILDKKANTTFDFQEKLSFYEYFALYALQNNVLDREIKKNPHLYSYEVYKSSDGNFQISRPAIINDFIDFDIESIDGFYTKFELPINNRMIEELQQDYAFRSILEFSGLFVPPKLFDFGIYDIDTKILKKITNNAYALDLSPNGDNLPVIIKNILESEDKEQFLADVAGILPFVEEIQVTRFDNMFDVWVKEEYNKQKTRGSLISDGTVAVITFIIILYYQKQQVIFIEEPEHGLHPSLIDDLLRVIYDAAAFKDKQVFITTHSPDLLRNLKQFNENLDDLILIYRDEESGNSVMNRPVDKEMVKTFLEIELGLDELFVQNLLND